MFTEVIDVLRITVVFPLTWTFLYNQNGSLLAKYCLISFAHHTVNLELLFFLGFCSDTNGFD